MNKCLEPELLDRIRDYTRPLLGDDAGWMCQVLGRGQSFKLDSLRFEKEENIRVRLPSTHDNGVSNIQQRVLLSDPINKRKDK